MRFIQADSTEQAFLLPPDMRDWLPEDDVAWVIGDAVEQMDLKPFYLGIRTDGHGRPSYEPKAMVSVLLYAYSTGVRSSRKIERLCRRDVGFRVLAGNLQPDHATLARFRRDHHEELAGLFTEALKLCRVAGMVRMGVVALDGTKIKANAALDSNRTYPSIEEEVGRILKEAETTDREEDARLRGGCDDDVPPELRSREGRLKRLQECKARLESEAKAKADEQRRKIEARAAVEARRGEKLRGRKPSEPKKKPEEEAKANVTDPESRIMKTRSGYVQGYNAQAIVTEDQVIVAAEITDEANDVKQLHPMLEAGRSDLRTAGVTTPIENVLADAGYWSESNAKRRGNAKAELFVATNKDWKQRKALRDQPPPRGRIPDGLSLRDRMERKLLTKRGRGLYRKRGQTIEPTFGQIKSVRGFERFMMRGKVLCASEWKLICATHNLLKLWRKQLEQSAGAFSLFFRLQSPVLAGVG